MPVACHSLCSRHPSETGIDFRESVRGTTGGLFVGLQIGRRAGRVVLVSEQPSRAQDCGVKADHHFIHSPTPCRSRPARPRPIVRFTAAAEIGTPESKTHTPCFLYIRPFPGAGRRMM